MVQCQCIASTKKQCKNQASIKPGENHLFCWAHQNCKKVMPNVVNVNASPAPISIKPTPRAPVVPSLPRAPQPLQPAQNGVVPVKQTCDKLGILKNIHASCYIDSTLLSLLLFENSYINQYILNADLSKIQITIMKNTKQEKVIALTDIKPLYDITELIQKDLKQIKANIILGVSDTCTLLRKHLTSHQNIYSQSADKLGKIKQIDWSSEQQEPLEVMIRLGTIFNLPDPTKLSTTSYGTNVKGGTGEDLTVINKQNLNIPFTFIISPFDLVLIDQEKGSFCELKNKIGINGLLQGNEIQTFSPCNYIFSNDRKKAFKYLVKESLITYSPLVYVHLTRVFDKSKIFANQNGKTKVYTSVVPDKTLKFKDNAKELLLSAVTIHSGSGSGGHYMAYLNCEGVWYFYNDLSDKLVKVGTYEQMLTDNSAGKETVEMCTIASTKSLISIDITVLTHATDLFYF